MSLHNKPKKAHSTGIVPEGTYFDYCVLFFSFATLVTYAFEFFADYICTENDIALIESVKSNSSGDELLVEIDHALVYRRDLQCLFQRNEYLNDAVSTSDLLKAKYVQIFTSAA